MVCHLQKGVKEVRSMKLRVLSGEQHGKWVVRTYSVSDGIGGIAAQYARDDEQKILYLDEIMLKPSCVLIRGQDVMSCVRDEFRDIVNELIEGHPGAIVIWYGGDSVESK